MNKKEFKKCMQQGLGRCAIVLKKSDNIEKYKDVVLWGCLHNLSYDTQSESTRAEYVYKLTTYFDDEDYFVIPTIQKFDKLPIVIDWDFCHFKDLLTIFAKVGNVAAKEALQRKYDRYLSILLKKRRFNRYDYERDNFDRLCVSLFSLDGMDILFKILSDLGHLFKENPNYDCYELEYFCYYIQNELGKEYLLELLECEATEDENIRCFYENYLNLLKGPQDDEDDEDESKEEASINEDEATSNDDEDRSNSDEATNSEVLPNEDTSTDEAPNDSEDEFSSPNTHTTLIQDAREIINTDDLDTKANLLYDFAYLDTNFPLSHETIIEYSKSSHEDLSIAAFKTLTNCKSSTVRNYAISLLENEKHQDYAIKMLINNYSSEIKELLLSELYKLKIDYDDTFAWHDINFRILDAQEELDIKLPKDFFFYIYNTSLCSCCRNNAVRRLSKLGVLTRDIIEECRYDSNSKISSFIKKTYPRR